MYASVKVLSLPQNLGRPLAKVHSRPVGRKLAGRVLRLGLCCGYRKPIERTYQQIQDLGFDARPAGHRRDERPH